MGSLNQRKPMTSPNESEREIRYPCAKGGFKGCYDRAMSQLSIFSFE